MEFLVPDATTLGVATVEATDIEPVIECLNRAMADARINGVESSEYFLDKCGAEAGDYLEPLTDAQHAVLEQAAPKVRGRVLSSLLPKRKAPP